MEADTPSEPLFLFSPAVGFPETPSTFHAVNSMADAENPPPMDEIPPTGRGRGRGRGRRGGRARGLENAHSPGAGRGRGRGRGHGRAQAQPIDHLDAVPSSDTPASRGMPSRRSRGRAKQKGGSQIQPSQKQAAFDSLNLEKVGVEYDAALRSCASQEQTQLQESMVGGISAVFTYPPVACASEAAMSVVNLSSPQFVGSCTSEMISPPLGTVGEMQNLQIFDEPHRPNALKEGAQKRTKSRKSIDNESLPHQLTKDAPHDGPQHKNVVRRKTGKKRQSDHLEISDADREDRDDPPYVDDANVEVPANKKKSHSRRQRNSRPLNGAHFDVSVPSSDYHLFKGMIGPPASGRMTNRLNISNPIMGAYTGLEIIEDWRPYCPYPAFSASIDHFYENGRAKISSLPLFGSCRTTPCMDKTKAAYYDLAINAGGSIWALDWCPQRGFRQVSGKEYLAIGAYPYNVPVHKVGEAIRGKGLIQIWALNAPLSLENQDSSVSKSKRKRKKKKAVGQASSEPSMKDRSEVDAIVLNDVSHPNVLKGRTSRKKRKGSSIAEGDSDLPQMVLGLAHEGGLVCDAKWQPAADGSLDLNSNDLYRLGYLAALFGDGSIQVFDVPLPSAIKEPDSSFEPVVVKTKPVFRCSGLLSASKQKSMPMTLEWSSSPSDLILAGYHDGVIALWKFHPSFSRDEDCKPLMCFVADSGPIRAISCSPWGNEIESRNIIATGGHSGRLQFWDIRDPFHPLWDLNISKGGFILSMDWFLDPQGIVLSMDDGSLRTLSIEMASCDTPVTGNPCTKTATQGMHSIFSSSFAIWTVHVSRKTGLVAYGGEDGSVRFFQLTKKFMLSDRARAREPHFMCCTFKEDQTTGVLSISSLNSDAPIHFKKSRPDHNQTPSKAAPKKTQGITNEGGKKRARKYTSKSLLSSARGKSIYGDQDTGITTSHELSLVPYSQESNSNSSEKNTSMPTLAEDEGVTDRVGEMPERMPAKSVSIHRIRWNQNKGYESWVCFGGAAGIVRCQIIAPSA